MTRRTAIALATAAAVSPAETPAPGDAFKLNAFVKQFNLYRDLLNSGVRSIEQWKRVRAHWDRLE